MLSSILPFSINEAIANDRRVNQAIKLLTARKTEPSLTIMEIAMAVNLSPSRLRHLFHRELGVSPSQYLKLARLSEAHRLLQFTFVQVKEAMIAAGFNDPSHFTRTYKKMFHESPSQTRKIGNRFGR